MTAALAKLHIAKKELALHDDDYRAILTRETGQASARGLSEAQIGKVLDVLKGMGWTPRVLKQRSDSTNLNVLNGGKEAAKTPLKGRRTAEHPTAKKARALWISLWRLGVVRNRSDAALEAFAARQLKCERLIWADQQQMYKLIEALKAMAEKAGWSQDVSGVDPALHTTVLKERLDALLAAKKAP